VVDVIQYNTSTLNRYIDGDDILEHWYCTANLDNLLYLVLSCAEISDVNRC